MKYKFILLFLLFIFFQYNLYPQYKTDSTSTIFQTLGYDFKTAINSGIKTYSAPLRFDKKDFVILGLVSSSIAIGYWKDESVRRYSKKKHSESLDNIMKVSKQYGEIYTSAFIGGAIYGYGLFGHNEYIRETGRMVFESVLYAGLLTTVIKSVGGRSRPYTEEGKNMWRMFSFESGNTSFPSGHSTLAFAVSSVLSNRIDNVYASIGLYSLASLTALSRVYDDKHWFSDIIAGSAIGYFIGDFVSKEHTSSQGKKYIVYPTINGIGFIYKL